VRQTWRQRLAVFAFALAVVAAIVGVSFAAGYIIGRLIL
jgi:hypothetical protein